MSTFADQARDKALEIERLMMELRKDISESKTQVRDERARECLTRLQSALLIIGTDCAQLKSALMTARNLGEFRHHDPDPELEADYAYPDHRCAAANDDTLKLES